MIISSIVLFFRRDCAGGAGPAVEAPRLGVAAVVEGAPPLAASVVVVVVVAGAVVDGAVVAAVVAAPAVVVAVVVVAVVDAGWVVSAGFPNENKPPVLGACVGAAVALVVSALLAAVLCGTLTRENRDPPAGAGVEDGVVEEVVPPRLGNRGFCGVAVDEAVVEGCEVAVVLGAEKRDFCESELVEGNLKSDDDDCMAGVVLVDAAVVAAPNKGFEPLSEVAGVFWSPPACLSVVAAPNRDPPLEVEGVVPNKGFDVPPCPKRPPLDGAEVVAGVVDAADVVPNEGFCPPKRDCP